MILKAIEPLHDLVLKPVTDKLWQATSVMQCRFVTDEGVYLSTIKPGFLSDLRSGCDLINILVPKWGNQQYTWCVVGGHDLLFCLGTWSFEFANELFLHQGLSLSGQISQWRANLAYNVVSRFGRSHFCDQDTEPDPPYHLNRMFGTFELLPR